MVSLNDTHSQVWKKKSLTNTQELTSGELGVLKKRFEVGAFMEYFSTARIEGMQRTE